MRNTIKQGLLLLLCICLIGLTGCAKISNGDTVDPKTVATLNGWESGSGAPGTISGSIEDDKYINIDNGDIYDYQSGIWVKIANVYLL